MRRKSLAILFTALALTSLGTAAGASQTEAEMDYVCIRSRLLLGDPVCIHYTPGQN